MNERQRIEAAIKAISNLAGVLDQASIDAAVLALSEQLSQRIEAERSIRQVTVLFADVVGSTQMSWDLDPDEIHTIIDGSLKKLSAVIGKHEGVVLQYAGDSLLAVFGAKQSREDDPIRATDCGIALIQESKRIAARLLLEQNISAFDVRVGIHTGPVLLGGGLDEPSHVRGSAVNIAARLEQSAPAGFIQVSLDTHRHIRKIFECTEAPSLQLKGRDRSLKAYFVLKRVSARPRNTEGWWTGHKPMFIGRQTELQLLEDSYFAVAESACSRSVILIGEAGIGKTTLLQEFLRVQGLKHPQGLATITACAQPYWSSSPYGLVREAVLCAAGVDSDADPTTARQAVRSFTPQYIKELGDGELAALESLIIGEAALEQSSDVSRLQNERNQKRAFRAAVTYLLTVHAPRPIAICLEDIHWADDGSLDFIDYILRSGSRILVVATTRIDLERRRLLPFSNRLELKPFNDKEIATLIRASVKDDAFAKDSPLFVRMIASLAEGNPYFVEETVGMLVEEGVLHRNESGSASLDAAKLLETKIPTTLTGVLQARLSNLPHAELETLQVASVIGNEFWDEALAKLGALDRSALSRLTERHLIRSLPHKTDPGHQKFQFRHQLMQRAVYETIPNRLRKIRHGLTARWIIDAFPDRLDDFSETIACHFERAGETELAINYFRRAGQYAGQRCSFEAAAELFRRAADICSEARLRFLLLSTEFHMRMEKILLPCDIEKAIKLTTLAEEINDDECRATAASLLTTCLAAVGKLSETRIAAKSAIRFGRISGRTSSVIRAHNQLGAKLGECGHFRQARRHLSIGHAIAARENNVIGAASALSKLSDVCIREGDYPQARSLLQKAIAHCKNLVNDQYERHLELLAANLETRLGNLQTAHESLLQLSQHFRNLDWPDMELEIALSIAMNRLWAGEHKEARVWLVKAQHMPVARPETSLILKRKQLAGEIELTDGTAEDAATHFQEALNQCAELSLGDASWEIKISLAYAQMELGALPSAERVALDFADAVATGDIAKGFFFDPANVFLRAKEILKNAHHDQQAVAMQRMAQETYEWVNSRLDIDQRSCFRTSSPGLRRLHQEPLTHH
ncbi:AAA family ATPase [Aquincola tertiaricarbonis]|uniref:AAA family ATPase n=1 Tax=Aquincola tertiaricarbonis TaxID=391953 RepID=A0ABY4SHK0_AQUTE|nr:adenylate/guanylate cyclase domain-containing protein [Aquincola tertiaricarbonis]URI11640.1 AAA family ATPase [Aquincola tertiaricarbonis]